MSSRPTLVTTEQKQNLANQPILIIDRLGILGEELVKKFAGDSLIVLVSSKPFAQALNKGPEIIHIPYVKKIPAIPDNTYSYIFVIDHTTSLIKDALSTFLEKARNDASSLIFVLNLFSASDKLVAHIQSVYGRVKIFIYGDIFGRQALYRNDIFGSRVNQILYQAKKFGRIEVAGEGMSKTYPVFLDDVISGIMEGVFGYPSSTSLFYLFPKVPPTELFLGHLIQKRNPLIRLDFIQKKQDKKALSIPKDGVYLLKDKYELGQKLKEAMDNQDELLITEKKEIDFEKKSFPLLFRFILFIIFILITPLLSTLFFSLSGSWALENTKSRLMKGDIENVRNSALLARNLFFFAKESSLVLSWEGRPLGLENFLEQKVVRKIDSGVDLSLGVWNFAESQKKFIDAISGKSKNPNEEIVLAQNHFKKALVFLQKIQAESLPASRQGGLPFEVPLLSFAEATVDVLPSLLGFEEKRTYLLLFQNNMELRPGGGFIGSYALGTLDKGKITDFVLEDVYDADGQLKGHVEPPYPIRRFLPSAHWYLRDSNFDVDFAKSASAAAYFFNIEKGKEVDGVIGIDLSFIRKILSVLGPVSVPDYNEEVTKENVFEITQKHVEKNFFPGSTQKKDFLKTLYSAILLSLSSKKISYMQLLKEIEDSLKEKHVLFAFRDAHIQNLFTVNRWSSSVWDDREEEKSVSDFLGISEANLGINKANYFIERKVSQKIVLGEDGRLSEELSILYNNKSDKWPGGEYKNYLRIILPLGTVLSSISFDSVTQELQDAVTDPLIYEKKGFVAPKGLEVEKREESQKTIYGFLVSVPQQSTKTITVSYTLPKIASLTDPSFSYNLFLFKQPGTDNYPYSFSLSYPKNLRVLDTPLDSQIRDSQISFSLDQKTDMHITIPFARE